MKRIIYILLCLLSALPNRGQNAQNLYNGQMRIENKSVTRSDDNRLTIAMDVVLQPNLMVTSNRALVITPVLQAADNNKVLPEIYVFGRRRELYNQRNHKMPKAAYSVIRRKKNKEQVISYLVQFPYEVWMQRADLTFGMDVSGCCNAMLGATVEEQVHKLNIEVAKPQLQVAYITPTAEAVKHRAVVGKAYLDFPVNQTVINPNYRNNSAELTKLRATIDTVRNDKNTTITSITIEGYASPEGTYTSNARLAEGRTKALMQYVRNYYKFDDNLLKVYSTPEDWVGYRKFIEASNITQKNEVLRIMDDDALDYDVREKKIATLLGPEGYRFILDNCYPALRHSDYTVSYTVRGFSIEEAKEILKKRPQQLSLQEIFNVAQTYEKGSDDFNHAFLAAVLMFPDDETANLNAAAMELQKGGDLTDAKRYLAKANQEDAATLNNLGIVAMREGDLDKAEEYFKKAEKATGANEVYNNMKELMKQRNFPTE